jgi:hypothetical protein
MKVGHVIVPDQRGHGSVPPIQKCLKTRAFRHHHRGEHLCKLRRGERGGVTVLLIVVMFVFADVAVVGSSVQRTKIQQETKHGRKSISRRLGQTTIVNIMLVIASDKSSAISDRWGQRQVALNSGVVISTVRRLEGMNSAIGARLRTIEKIRRSFDRAGFEFIGDPNPGVRLRDSRE